MNDFQKLIEDNVNSLYKIGADPTGGASRLLYDEGWIKAQEWLCEKFKEASMETRRDEIGNLYGKVTGTELPNEVIASGSHIDTVVNGGKLDGQYGILAGLMAIDYLLKTHGKPLRTIEIVSFAEEEGSRFPFVFWGSKNYLNLVDEKTRKELSEISDAKGVKFVDAMKKAGFDFAPDKETRKDIKAFLEIHIEQGNVLETSNQTIGVVNAIAGQRRYDIHLTGQANHAGTTPMGLRKDAVYCFSKICSQCIDKALKIGDPLVLTFGKVNPSPNVVNVVPGNAMFTMDCRHPVASELIKISEEFEADMKKIAADMGLGIEIDRWMDAPPVPMDQSLVSILEKIVKDKGLPYRVMHSGAGHDSQVIAPIIPTAMLFVPSIEGVSHNPAEDTKIEELEAGIKVLTDAFYELAYK